MGASRVAIAAVAVFVAAAGAASRLLSGNALLHTDLVYSPAQKERIPGAFSPESAARSFYLYVDAGMYDKAYEIILEPARSRSGSPEEGKGSGRFPGWTTLEDFVDRMNKELGPGGTNIRLGSIRAGQPEPFDSVRVSNANIGGSDSAQADTLLSRVTRLEGAYRVAVDGHMLGACSVFRWEKELIVVKSDGQYKVLLDGAKGGPGFSYRSWFENIEKLSDLKGGAHSRVLK
jgi:hypothetical protein